jgi:hypothetical protein
MAPTTAFLIITWLAIVVLFLGLAAVLREVRLLRGLITREPHRYATSAPDIALGGRFARGGGPRIVLAVDSGCPLCLAVTQRLAARDGTGPPVVLLTHEPPESWAGIAGPLEVVSDRESWRAVAHLSPPVLMLVDGGGRVERLVLPVREQEADEVWDRWRESSGEENPDVVDARANS